MSAIKATSVRVCSERFPCTFALSSTMYLIDKTYYCDCQEQGPRYNTANNVVKSKDTLLSGF